MYPPNYQHHIDIFSETANTPTTDKYQASCARYIHFNPWHWSSPWHHRFSTNRFL